MMTKQEGNLTGALMRAGDNRHTMANLLMLSQVKSQPTFFVRLDTLLWYLIMHIISYYACNWKFSCREISCLI